MAGAFLTPEQLAAMLDQQAGGTPPRTAGAFAAPDLAPDPFQGQVPQMGFSPDDPTMSTGDMNLAPQPQRMLAGAWDMIARKRQAGVPLSPQEEAMVASGERYKAEVGEPGAINAIGEMSGVNGMRRGGENMAAGYEAGSPLQMAAGAGEAAINALPWSAAFKATAPIARSIFSSAPRAMGFGAATSLPGAALESQEAQAAKSRDQIQQELAGMQPADLRAYQQAIGVAPDGKVGPATISAAMEADRRREADAAQRAAVEMAAAQGDAAAKKEAARIKAEAEAGIMRDQARAAAAAEQKQKQVATPLRELYPEYMPWLAAAGPIAAMGMGARIMGKRAGAYNDEISDLKDRTNAAIAAKDKPLASGLNEQLLRRQKEGYDSGFLPAIASGAGINAKASIVPEELDLARGVPGAWDRMTDIPTLAKRVGMGGFFGALAAGTGGEFRKEGLLKPKVDYSPEVAALKASRGKAASKSSTAEEALQQARSARQNVDAEAALVAAANRRQPQTASGTADTTAQSPRPGSSQTQEPQAAGQQLSPSGGSQRSSSVSPSNKSGDNTAAVSPRQFIPGQRAEPVSGLRKSMITNDTSALELARNMAASGEKVTAANYQAAAKQLGLDMSLGQANRVVKEFKQDAILQELKANFVKDRKRMQRAAKKAQEQKNLEKPPEID